jgi:hypothetical protein
MTSPETSMNPLRWLWRGLRGLLLVLAAIVLFIEEWGWRPLTAWAARLASWPPLARLEAHIVALPPRWALALFIVPAIALFPVKLVALWLIHLGRTTLGVAVIVAAKLIGTALVGRLFTSVVAPRGSLNDRPCRPVCTSTCRCTKVRRCTCLPARPVTCRCCACSPAMR